MASDGDRNPFRKSALSKGKGNKLFKPRAKRVSTQDEETNVQHSSPSNVLANKAHALRLFEKAGFEIEDFMQNTYCNSSERDIQIARRDLESLLEYCNQELHKVVHKNYKLFLDACQGVGEMEEKIQLLRNQVNSISAVVEQLRVARANVATRNAAAAAAAPQDAASSGAAASAAGPISRPQPSVAEEIESQVLQLLQALDVAVAERDLAAVRELLAAGKEVMGVLEAEAEALYQEVPDYVAWQHRLEAQVAERKQKMIKVLERILSEPTTSLPEVRSATRVLAHLVGNCHAASVMLHCHSQKVKQHQALLLKMHSSGGGDPDGTEYAGGLAQRTFMAVGRAADDVAGVFGAGCQEVQALFTVWAAKETKQCAALLRRHALSPFAAPSGLQASVLCVSLAVVFCSALEHTHSLCLAGVLLGEVLPHIEGVLKRHVRRVQDELKASISDEVSNLATQCITQGGAGSSWWNSSGGLALISSASLVAEVKGMVQTLQPLAGPRMAAAIKKALLELVSALAQGAGTTFARFVQADPTYGPILRPLAEALMRHLGELVEGQLPATVAPLDTYTTPLCDVEQLDTMLDAVAQQCGLA